MQVIEKRRPAQRTNVGDAEHVSHLRRPVDLLATRQPLPMPHPGDLPRQLQFPQTTGQLRFGLEMRADILRHQQREGRLVDVQRAAEHFDIQFPAVARHMLAQPGQLLRRRRLSKRLQPFTLVGRIQIEDFQLSEFLAAVAVGRHRLAIAADDAQGARVEQPHRRWMPIEEHAVAVLGAAHQLLRAHHPIRQAPRVPPDSQGGEQHEQCDAQGIARLGQAQRGDDQVRHEDPHRRHQGIGEDDLPRRHPQRTA